MVRVVWETSRLMLAWIVDASGTNTDRQWLIDLSMITKRESYQINRTYGTLEKSSITY